MTRESLFLTHIIKVINYISSEWPSVRVLLWDDMFRDFSICDLEELGSSADCVIPVVWSYVDNLMDVFPKGMFEKFGEVFEEIWIASSFKGSAGMMLSIFRIGLSLGVRWKYFQTSHPCSAMALETSR